MAQTEHLPIYKASYDLCLYLEQVVHGFARYQQHTLGSDLRDGARRDRRAATADVFGAFFGLIWLRTP
jgi:hypothetical protein